MPTLAVKKNKPKNLLQDEDPTFLDRVLSFFDWFNFRRKGQLDVMRILSDSCQKTQISCIPQVTATGRWIYNDVINKGFPIVDCVCDHEPLITRFSARIRNDESELLEWGWFHPKKKNAPRR